MEVKTTFIIALFDNFIDFNDKLLCKMYENEYLIVWAC
jgi:hypothetical protein